MPAVDPAQRRAEIVMAAFGLLAEGGAEAATMRRVATAAGATTGRVTHYFESRVELLVAALIEVDRRRHQRIAAHDGLEPADRLRAVLEERLPLDTARLSELRVWLALASTNLPEARDELTSQSVAWDRLVRSLLTDANVSVDPAESLVAMVDGLALRLMLDATRRTRRTAAAALDDLLRGRDGDKV
jgi:AcrR family transcriptional regulator